MRKRTVVTLAAIVALLTGPAAIGQESIDVQTTVLGGTRTLTMKSLTGETLSSMSMGATGSSGFLAAVTDVQYNRVGYQVNATLSDLYAYSDDTFDCATRINSDRFSLDFLTDPVSVADVGAVVETVWDLAGSLDPAVALLLGSTELEIVGVQGELIESLLADAVSAASDALPLKVAVGTGGAFTSPGPHTACNPAPSSATTLSLQNGNVSNLSDLLDWVTSAVLDVTDLSGDGVVTGAELVDSGVVEENVLAEATRSALADAGVSLALVDSLLASGGLSLADIYGPLLTTLEPITSLLGQTGLYMSMPRLNVSVADGTPAGTYRGTLTVTLVDV